MKDSSYCAGIARAHARTFWLASALLPAEKRRGAFALYAYCRIADDIVDEGGTLLEAAASRQLARHEAHLDRALRGQASDPVFRELAWAIARFGIPRAPLDELLAGVRGDLERKRYPAWRDLERYCAAVASSVGEMCVYVFGVAERSEPREVVVAQARSLGIAMQLTNILRDVGEDARRGRCYLPLEDLATFGLEAQDLLAFRVRSQDPAWRALVAFEIARARGYYERASPGIEMLEEDARACARACALGYASILGEIERRAYDSITSRARLGWRARLSVLLSAWTGVATASREEPRLSART